MNNSYMSELLKPQHPSFRSVHVPSMKGSAGIFEDEIAYEDERVVNRLVNNLIYLFNISQGDYLTFVLGYGHCTKNEDALKYWVMDQLAEHSHDSGDVLHHLVEHLKEQLNQEVYS